ncbi:MAG: AMIN domain-containing protein [Syntrophobacterales bacterium]|nr:MAG: AMIN domain-containing protein [Syntrophobacterales bacterium]
MLVNSEVEAPFICIVKQSNGHSHKMKNATRIICIALFSLALVCFLDSWALAAERVIKDIRFEKLSLTEEKVSFKLSEYDPPQVFGIEGKKGRLVCDFFDTKIEKHITRALTTDGNLVLGIRVGIHNAPKQKIRVVLDLAPLDKDYAIQQHFYEDNMFVVTVCLK